MTVHDLLQIYVGSGIVEITNVEDSQVISIDLAIELYDDKLVDYFYINDDDMGSYLTIVTKEEEI